MGSRDDTEAIKECFTLYDRENAGRIPCSRLGELVRSLGCHPTESDLSEYIRTTLRKLAYNCLRLYHRLWENEHREMACSFKYHQFTGSCFHE